MKRAVLVHALKNSRTKKEAFVSGTCINTYPRVLLPHHEPAQTRTRMALQWLYKGLVSESSNPKLF